MTTVPRGTAWALRALGHAAAPALSLAAFARAFQPSAACFVGGAALVVACLVYGGVAARRRPTAIDVASDGLVVDGVPARLRSAWLGPGWLVVRGLRDGARFRVSLFAFETTKAEFARLRAYCVAELPRVNPPRVGGRRARR